MHVSHPRHTAQQPAYGFHQTAALAQLQPAAMYAPLSTTELAQYFARISYSGDASNTLATLQQLHTLHSIAIAFDNLDAWLGKVPSLDEAQVFNKLVLQGRGGYCFEHNQLFMRVLQSLGFQVQAIAARVLLPNLSMPRNHHAILVNLPQGLYIADVGFGAVELTVPLALDSTDPQQGLHERWLMQPTELPASYLLSIEAEGQWVQKYSFQLAPQTRADFDMANWFTATHPDSFLRNNLLAARVDAEGRHALLNTQYTRYFKEEPPLSITIDSPRMLLQLLNERFHVNTTDIAGLEQRIARLCSGASEEPLTPAAMDRKIDEHFHFEATDNVEGVLATLAADVEHDIVGLPSGPVHCREDARHFYEALFQDLSDGQVSKIRRYYGDHFMVDESLWSGRAPGRPFGLDGRNRPLQFRLLHVLEFANDGNIKRENVWLDFAAIMQQLA